MEMKWHLFLIVANCAVHCVAKPVSLNEVIAAESQQKQVGHAESPKLKAPASERVPLKKGFLKTLLASNKFKETEGIIPLGKKISALKYKKTFQITSPLKLKRLKHRQNTRQKRRNPSVKREIGDESLRKKVPLLRSLGMLFDNLLGPDSGESTELRRKSKRIRYYTDTSEILCPCSSKSNARMEQEEEANTSAETISDETPPPTEAATATSYLTPAVHIRSFRQNKNNPVLLPRDTASGRRNNHELGERNSAAHHGSTERDLPRDHGDSQPSPGNRGHEPDAEDDEEDTDGHSRHGASSVRHLGGIRRLTTNAAANHTEVHKRENVGEASAAAQTKRPLESGGILNELKRDNQQQIRGIEAEGAELLPTVIGGPRGIVPANKVDIPKSMARAKIEEVDVNNHTDDQQLAHGSSPLAEEDKAVSAGHETVEHNIPTVRSVTSKKQPVVYIIDGYSVTRNKNGENKLKEKAIRIHSK